jgi:hypothetical protein
LQECRHSHAIHSNAAAYTPTSICEQTNGVSREGAMKRVSELMTRSEV